MRKHLVSRRYIFAFFIAPTNTNECGFGVFCVQRKFTYWTPICACIVNECVPGFVSVGLWLQSTMRASAVFAQDVTVWRLYGAKTHCTGRRFAPSHMCTFKLEYASKNHDSHRNSVESHIKTTHIHIHSMYRTVNRYEKDKNKKSNNNKKKSDYRLALMVMWLLW